MHVGSIPEWSGAGDGPRVLGLNPWVHDFAAYDLWSRPAGLLSCLESLRLAGARAALLDCLDRESGGPWPRRAAYGTGRYPRREITPPPVLRPVPRRYSRYGREPEQVREALSRLDPPPELVLVSCAMTYWYPGAREALELARDLWPGAVRLLGGTYATLCREHALSHMPADLVVSGPLEEPGNWRRLWESMGADAPPVPQGAGMHLALDLYHSPDHAPVMTSRGCPYACEYCAGRTLYPGFMTLGPEELYYVLRSEYERGVRDFAFFDDALLVGAEKRLWPALGRLEAENLNIRLHAPNALHLRLLTAEACGRLKRAGMTTLRLGLETADFHRRRDAKLRVEEWRAAASHIREAGFPPGRVGVYLLFGLPGQDEAEVERSISEVRAQGFRPHLAHYSPIPGSPMFEEARRASDMPLAEEPLTQNPSIWPCRPGGFDWNEAGRWKRLTAGRETGREGA